jgi:hypothetical protein
MDFYSYLRMCVHSLLVFHISAPLSQTQKAPIFIKSVIPKIYHTNLPLEAHAN